jgi:hypothetical protein
VSAEHDEAPAAPPAQAIIRLMPYKSLPEDSEPVEVDAVQVTHWELFARDGRAGVALHLTGSSGPHVLEVQGQVFEVAKAVLNARRAAGIAA